MIKLPIKLPGKFSKEKVVAGLDIGTSTIKIAKLKFLKESTELIDVALEPTLVDLEAVLKKIAQAHGIGKVNISVSGPATIIRYASFPKMQVEELSQALKFEAQKQIPFAVADVNLDGHILKNDLPDNKMLVLVAAAKKDFINQRIKAVEDSGLKAALMDLDSLALINAFTFSYADEENLKHKTIALLNIGTAISSVNIVEDNNPRFSRDIQIGGNHFTQRIADSLVLDFKVAETMKLNPDKEKEEKISAAVEPVLANLAREVRVSFDYYESQNASSIAKIFLSGGGSKFIGLKDSLSSMLGIEAEYWDPLRKIIIANSVDSEKVKSLSAQLAVAVGLALRG